MTNTPNLVRPAAHERDSRSTQARCACTSANSPGQPRDGGFRSGYCPEVSRRSLRFADLLVAEPGEPPLTESQTAIWHRGCAREPFNARSEGAGTAACEVRQDGQRRGTRALLGPWWITPDRAREFPAVRRASTASFSTSSWLPARSSQAGGPSSPPGAGAATTRRRGSGSQRRSRIDVAMAAGYLYKRRQARDDEAKRAAGEKNVLVHGAATAQLALAAGLLDELSSMSSSDPWARTRMFDNSGPRRSTYSAPDHRGRGRRHHTHYRVAR